MELETPLKASTNNTFNKSIVPPSTVARKHMTKRKRLEDAIASLRLDGEEKMKQLKQRSDIIRKSLKIRLDLEYKRYSADVLKMKFSDFKKLKGSFTKQVHGTSRNDNRTVPQTGNTRATITLTKAAVPMVPETPSNQKFNDSTVPMSTIKATRILNVPLTSKKDGKELCLNIDATRSPTMHELEQLENLDSPSKKRAFEELEQLQLHLQKMVSILKK